MPHFFPVPILAAPNPVLIEYKIEDTRGLPRQLLDPDGGAKLTLWQPGGVKALDGQAMEKRATGHWRYVFQLPVGAVKGTWQGQVQATHQGTVSTSRRENLFIVE